MAREGFTGLLVSTANLRGAPFAELRIAASACGNSRVHSRVIEFVLPVIREEELQALAYKCFVSGLAAERPLDQDRRAIAHVAGDDVVRQLRPLDMAQCGVDRMHQIEARVNQRAVQVEDHESDGVRVKSAARTNHLLPE